MDWRWYLFAAALLGFAGASFFFALAESALFALGRWRVQQLTDSSAKLAALLREPQDLLATLVLGNTFANSAIVGIVVWFILHEDWPIIWALSGLLVFLLSICEVLPKTLGVRAPEFWSARVAAPTHLFIWLSRPFRQIAQRLNSWLLGRFAPPLSRPPASITDTEYQEVLEMALQAGALGQSEKEIISQIITLDQRTAREVMRPRSQVTLISDELSREEMIEAARKNKHTRLPIYDQTPDTIVGILNARALLLNPELDLEEVIEFPSFVPETMNLLQLLKSLQRQQRGMAIVLDEFGSAAGLVTTEDILQELLGPFGKSTHATGFRVDTLEPGRWRVNGTCLIEDFRRECPELPPAGDVETMSGLAVELFEYVPNRGESIVHNNLKLTAQNTDQRRIHELLVERIKK
jgi:putative hemolysin